MIQHLLGDNRDTLKTLPAGCVQTSVCSPPYWQLRSYLPKGHPLKPLEIGQEPTPAQFIANLMDVFDQVHRVTREDGTAFINIADTYAGGGRGGNPAESSFRKQATNTGSLVDRMPKIDLDAGNLVGIPWRFAQAMQSHGWILRDVIVWRKPAPMPASLSGWEWTRCRVKVKKSPRAVEKSKDGSNGLSPQNARDGVNFRDTAGDWSDCPGCKKCSPNGGYVLSKGSWRCTSAWEPIFMFSKSMGYYCDGHALRTAAAASTIGRNTYTRVIDDPDEQYAVAHDHEFSGATANMRNVWDIPNEPTKFKHYAAYPTKLAANCIEAGTSAKGCCPACGMGWARIVNRTPVGSWNDHKADEFVGQRQDSELRDGSYVAGYKPPETIGWRQSCQCPAHEPVPQTVLDPFGGTGRTAKAGVELGRKVILCELNPEYLPMQKETGQVQMPLPLLAGVA